MRPIPAIALGTMGFAEGFAALSRHEQRTVLYEMAQVRASELGRPLVVVGDPDAGAHTSLARAYGCGDVCVDLNGCPSCEINLKADITKPLPFADDSQVVFVSCVLEYVDDFEAAWKEIMRVAGSPQNVFCAVVQPWTFTSALYPGAKWTLHQDGSEYRAEPVSSARVVGSYALLAGLVAWMLWPE
jgi:hypothetical protein